MGRPMTEYDNISIAQIVIYSFYLIGGVYLCFKHGFTTYRFCVILSLARLIGSAMDLASISDPTNQNLYIGWLVLNGIGLGPLILTLMGVLNRLFNGIAERGRAIVTEWHQGAIQILMIVAIVLIIVGGTEANYTFTDILQVQYPTVSKVGAVLFIVVFAAIVAETIVAFLQQGYIRHGEIRLLWAVVAALPFVLVRLVYACVLILGSKKLSIGTYLGAGVIMEIIVVFICEAVGFVVEKPPKKNTDAENGAPREEFANLK